MFVENALVRMRPRGPDVQRSVTEQVGQTRVTLGCARLRITDPSPAADQPLRRGPVWGVLNGAIYNHQELREALGAEGVRFETGSDLETLLAGYAQWGVDVLNRLQGMFAFALVDERARKLVLARDRFGVKPLHYVDRADSFLFASTPDVLASHIGARANVAYAARGLLYRLYEDGLDDRPFLGIDSLPAGCVGVLDLASPGRLSIASFYDLAEAVSSERERSAGLSADDRVERTTQLVEEATRLRIQAERPSAAMVSGGLDSSSVAALMARETGSCRVYHYGLPGRPKTEARHVELLKRHVAIDPVYVFPTSRIEVADLFHDTLAAQGAPFSHPSIIAQFALFQAAKRDGIVVTLGGEGSDELFMGYRKFLLFQLVEAAREGRIGDLAAAMAGGATVVRHVLAQVGTYWGDRRRYLGGDVPSGLRLPTFPAPELGLPREVSVATRARQDVTCFSLPSLLRYEDRNAMAHGVESRLPFLHHPLVEFALALPVEERLRGGHNKLALRRAMKGVAPDGIRLSKDKRSFPVEEGPWFDLGLGDVIREALRAEGAAVMEWLPSGASIETQFSDQALRVRPQAVYDAVTALWLARHA